MTVTTNTKTTAGGREDGARYVEPTYGQWTRPRPLGIAGQGLIGTCILLAGMLVATFVAILTHQIRAGLVTAALVALVLAPLTLKIGGRSGGQYVLARCSWGLGARRRRNVYRSGPLSVVPAGTHQLPGLLAASRAHAATTTTGMPFALVEHPRNLWTVVLHCQPEGSELVDSHVLDNRVAGWGAFLASLARIPDLAAAQQVVEVVPDPGTRLSSEIARLVDPDSPEIARAALAEAAATMPVGQAVLTSRCALTWSTPRGVSQRRADERPEAMAEYVSRFLPSLCAGLSAAGAGPVALMDTAELAEELRMAYDPQAATAIETARAAGNDTRLGWSDAGPVGAVDGWESYRHDAATSISWAMTTAPAGEVVRDTVAGLLVPDPDALRRRVCFTYRPFAPDEARKLARRGARDAIWRAGQSRVGDAGDDLEIAAARQTQAELARGAGMVSFTLHVTTTAASGADLDQIAANVEQAAGGAEIGLRRCYGHQGAAFTAGLGIGVVLDAHVRVPKWISRNL